jgi:hypothetical protein
MAANKLKQEYNKDFYTWILKNVALIRTGRFSEIDSEHIAEELESMGRSERRELISRLTVLMVHLLKWKFQPVKRSKSWKYIIKEQRIQLVDLLEESPSLMPELDLKLHHAYEQAIFVAIRETGMNECDFPQNCPFSLKECLDPTFFPDGEAL